jgi:competence protein ComEC
MTLLCAAAGAASAALHAADLRRGPVPVLAAAYADVTLELTVTGDPHRTESRVRGTRRVPGVLVVPVEVARIAAATGAAPSTVRLPAAVRTPALLLVTPETGTATAWRRLLPSTGLQVEARLAPPGGPGGGRDVAAVLRASGRHPPDIVRPPNAPQAAAGGLRAGLREATDELAPDPRALLPGLVVGDTSRVPEDLDKAFHATDMLHLLAVSGGNLTVLLVLLIGPPGRATLAERRGLAPRLGIPLRTTAVLAALVTLGFVLVCRPQPSVLRAAACGLITILAIGTGRRRSLIPALAAAVLLLVLHDPWLAREPGFLLSVLATGSLLTVAPRWSLALRRRGVPGRLAEALAAAAAAQAACAPVVAVLASHVSLVAVPCNLLAEFAVAPATVLGFAALLAAPLSPALAEGFAWLGGWPTAAIALIARTGASVPGATVAWPGSGAGALLLATLLAALLVLARRLPAHPWLCALTALLLLLALVRPAPLTRTLTGWPPPGWRLVMCDVGQGDAIVLDAGNGAAVLIDAGPDPHAVDECLDSLGVTAIPFLVLTHFHADHVAGLPGALRGRSVGAIQTTGLQRPPDQAAFVHRVAARAGVRVVRGASGERRTLGPLTWQVLWPPAESSDVPALGGEDDANNASLTLLARTDGVTVFLAGDLEPPAQRRLLETWPDLGPVDVLKVAHHGSSYQDPALLERLDPRVALVSAGAGNPYGHPSPRTLRVLHRQGALVRRTDTSGPLAVITSDSGAPAVATSR